MKTISVSTDVFASLWGARAAGENTEDDILRRLLGLPLVPGKADAPRVGFQDRRHNVTFPAGFEIFRTYLGHRYSARAEGGAWVLGDGRTFASLNELSRGIGARTENAWMNWFYGDASGARCPVSQLRTSATVATRSRSGRTGGAVEPTVSTGQSSGEAAGDGTWRDDVRDTLVQLGGKAHLSAIYREVTRLRRIAGRSLPESLEATVRRTLEDHSSDSDNFRGADLFFMPEGKGAGVWALRATN
jgi:hypothetical protein